MLSFSPFLVLGLVSSVIVQAGSNLSSIIAQPFNWTVAGPNKLNYTLTTDGPEPISYDVHLVVQASKPEADLLLVRSYLMAFNQTAVSGQNNDVQVFPGSSPNATKELNATDTEYSVLIVGHLQDPTANGTRELRANTDRFNLTDPSQPSASPTSQAGGSSSVVSFSAGGPLLAAVGLVVAGGLLII